MTTGILTAILLAALAAATAGWIDPTDLLPTRGDRPEADGGPPSTGTPKLDDSRTAQSTPAGPGDPPADQTSSGAIDPGSIAESRKGDPDSGIRRRTLFVPEAGSGRLTTVPVSGNATAATTDAVTYVVQQEEGLPFVTVRVAAFVDAVLGDDRGWRAVGHRLVRVATVAEADVHVVLASPRTSDRLCAPLNTGGRLSCRNGSNVVLNAWRWLHGAAAYRDDLTSYRTYVVNHEVGHALGYPHRDCPTPGSVAPVMLQQTKGLDGCTANPWPVPADGR